MIARMPRDFRRSAAAIVLATLALLLVPLVASSFTLHVLSIAFYYVILAASWNLLAGYMGQFSLAHHAFAAIGAYTSGLLGYHLGISFWIGIPAGVALSAALGWVLGRLVLRMRAIYLAIATWAFAETVHIYLTADYKFTRGELGLSVKPLFGSVDPLPYYFTLLVLTAVVLLLLRALIDRRGQPVSRELLLSQIWADQPFITPRTVDVHVAWLRNKLEDDPPSPRHILTVRGEGYRFER